MRAAASATNLDILDLKALHIEIVQTQESNGISHRETCMSGQRTVRISLVQRMKCVLCAGCSCTKIPGTTQIWLPWGWPQAACQASLHKQPISFAICCKQALRQAASSSPRMKA